MISQIHTRNPVEFPLSEILKSIFVILILFEARNVSTMLEEALRTLAVLKYLKCREISLVPKDRNPFPRWKIVAVFLSIKMSGALGCSGVQKKS